MKPNAFTKLYVHYVFSPYRREAILLPPKKEIIQKYIYGIVQENNCKPVAINGFIDHLHLLIGINPQKSISDLIRDIKRSSSLMINKEQLFPFRFAWQEGYGAFTVGHREVDRVYKYIINQENHHKSQSFRDEFVRILDEEGFKEYENFLFEFYH